MTDIIDHLHQSISQQIFNINPDYVYARYHFQKFIQYQNSIKSQTSISLSLHDQKQIQCYQKCIPFSHDQLWNFKLLLLIKHLQHQIKTQIKILSPKGNILKVISQYHRTYLYRRFLQKNKQSDIIGKINPQTGEISLCTVFFYHKITTNDKFEQIIKNLMNSVFMQKLLIEQIINLIQNKQQNIQLIQNKQNSTNIPAFIALCSKRSQKQIKIPFKQRQNYICQRKQIKSRTYGGGEENNKSNVKNSKKIKVKEMTKYLNNPLQSIEEILEYDKLNYHGNTFKKEVRNILGGVQNSLVRKDSPLKTYEVVKLPAKNYQHIITSIKSMKQQRKSKQTTKLQKSGFGKLTVQIQLKRYSSVQKTYKFLTTLPEQLQLSFLNNYFGCQDLLQHQQGKQVIIQLAIRRQQLISYLQSNSNCISFSTKLRILSQLISSTYLLQNNCNSIIKKMGISNFSIAKNMMIKINNLEYLQNLTQQKKHLFQHQIQMNFIQNQINISKIYAKLFYQKELLYFKPSKKDKMRLSQIFSNSNIQEQELIIDKIYEECGLYGPKKIMALLTCIFIPYIPMVSFQQIKNDPPCKNLKWGIASLIKILQNIN